MIIATVSTIKDRLPNVQHFVQANLASGVDHLFIMLDGPDPEVESWLASRPEVTAVVTDKQWWQGKRPRLLNRRQNINANLVKAVLAVTGGVDWLFHIDGDEVAQIDRDVLAALPSDQRAARLMSFEVVSTMHAEGRPTLFKPLLDKPDLHLLFALGLLSEPTNMLYFRSHIVGKAGMRPSLDLWQRIHQVADRRGEHLKLQRDPALRVLHYESYSGEEFVRKWTAMIGSGPDIHFGPHRMRLADGMKALLSKDLDPEVAQRYLEEIYHRHMEDSVEKLDELGLLREIDPLQGGHRPQALDASVREGILARFEALRPVDKSTFLREVASAKQTDRLLRRTFAGLPRT